MLLYSLQAQVLVLQVHLQAVQVQAPAPAQIALVHHQVAALQVLVQIAQVVVHLVLLLQE